MYALDHIGGATEDYWTGKYRTRQRAWKCSLLHGKLNFPVVHFSTLYTGGLHTEASIPATSMRSVTDTSRSAPAASEMATKFTLDIHLHSLPVWLWHGQTDRQIDEERRLITSRSRNFTCSFRRFAADNPLLAWLLSRWDDPTGTCSSRSPAGSIIAANEVFVVRWANGQDAWLIVFLP